MPTLEQKAVIDRIEDATWAVLLVGDNEEERVIPIERLPGGAGEGTWLRIRIDQDAITEILVDTEETEAARERIRSKMDALRQRTPRFRPIASDDSSSSDTPHAKG